MPQRSRTSETEGHPFAVYPLVVAGLVSFALSPILIRLATDAPALSLAVWRTLFAVAMLAPFAVGRIGEEVRQFDARDIRLIIASGVLLAAHFVLWIESLYHTSVAAASVLVATSPIFLAVLGFFLLGERLSKRAVVAIVLAVCGSVLIGMGDMGSAAPFQGNSLYGNLLAATASLMVSGYLLIGRVVRRKTSWLAYVFCIYSVVAVLVLALALIRGVPLLGLDPKVYLMCTLMALGPQIIGHGSFNYAVKYIPAAILGLLSLTEPIGGSLVAYLLFDEMPGLLGIVGMVVVLASVASALRRPKRASAGVAE
ncbi:MAG: DMT family transporter [Rhodothermia bacterium]|nr:DMT family transporter [Rhodothermia bacterium]